MNPIIYGLIGIFVGVAVGFLLCAVLSNNRETPVSEDTQRIDFLQSVDAGITRVDGGDYWAILWGKPIVVRRIAKSLRDVIDQGMDEYALGESKSGTLNDVGQKVNA